MENQINSIDQFLNNYENSLKQGPNKGLDKEEKKKKKFKIGSDSEKFRFMKMNTKFKYYDEAYFHEVRVGKYNQKIYCLKNDGEECPLCKKHETLLNKQYKGKKDDLTKEQLEHNKKYYEAALQYKARKHYVFEGIDRGIEKDGKKIWLVKENLKKDGVLDKLIPAIKAYNSAYGKDYTDINEGVDMIITSVQDKIQATNSKYWKVTGINPAGKPSKLHNDEDIMNKYINDTTTWKDVYGKYEITGIAEGSEMLSLIAEGNAPYWDEDKKSFIFPNRPDLQKKYDDSRKEEKNKISNGPSDNVNPIADIMFNKNINSLDDEDEDLEASLNQIKNNSDFDIMSNVDDDFDDLPF